MRREFQKAGFFLFFIQPVIFPAGRAYPPVR
jgi:hypothetical protein